MGNSAGREDFVRLYLSVHPTLRSYVFALVRDMAEAEDILQEVSTVLWRDFDRYDSDRPFVNWAVGIARNHVSSWRRNRARSKVVLVPVVEQKIADTYAEMQDELEGRRRRLQSCMEKVAPWGRELLRLRYEKEHTLARIAELKRTTLNAINKALGRVRAFLVKCTGSGREGAAGLGTS